MGPRRIRDRLRRMYGLSLSTKTIHHVLRRHGLNHLDPPKKRVYQRFEHRRPNELVQIEILEPFYLRRSRRKNYLVQCLDDHSRVALSRRASRKSAEEVIAVLEAWISRYGRSEAMLTDKGRPFTS